MDPTAAPSTRSRARAGAALFVAAAALAEPAATAVVAAAPAAAAAAADDAEGEAPWAPLAVGERWTYHVLRDLEVDSPGSDGRRSFYEGREYEEVAGVKGEGPRVFDVLRVRREQNVSGGPLVTRRTSLSLSNEGGGLSLHGHRVLEGASPAEGASIEYDPPAPLLPGETDPGTTWKVGALRNQALRLELAGRVVGREPLELPGREYPEALKILHEGPVHGSFYGSVGLIHVESGSYHREIWHVRGVGIVRDVSRFSVEGRGPDGASIRLSDVTRRRLLEHAPAAPVD